MILPPARRSMIPMKTGIFSAIGLVLFIIASIIFIRIASPADAVSTAGFKPGDIMSDAVMSNTSTMTESQIQSFLKSKNPCNNPVAGSGVTVSSNTRAYVKGTLNGQPATWWWNISGGANGHFLCMADDKFSGQSAAHVIYQAAQDYNINPQVLIVLLQKEQGLITDTWPNDHQYAAATGYNCPDTPSGCNNANAGFITQVRSAASLFHDVLTGGWSNYPVGDNVILYNPSTSCGSSRVNIVNRATSALYRYTPYQPNSATLSAGWPSPGVSCGAYGNLNFYMYFTQWFGNTHYAITGSILKYYNANNGSVILGAAADLMHSNGDGFYWQKFENGYIAGQSDTGYYAIKGSIGTYYDTHSGPSLFGKPLSAEQNDATTGIWSQAFSKGHITGTGSTGYFSTRGALDTSYQKGGISKYGQPLTEQISLGAGAYSQQFQNGYYIVGSNATGYYESTGAIRNYWTTNGSNKGSLGLPISNITPIGSGAYQLYQGGAITGSDTTNYFAVKGSIGATYLDNISKHFENLGFPIANEVSLGGAYEQQFQNGYITGANGHYYRTSNAIHDYWKANGAQNGMLGLPIGLVDTIGSGEIQAYTGGVVLGSSANGYYTVKGSIGKTYLSNISQNYNDLGMPTNNESGKNNVWQQQFEHGCIIGSYSSGYWPISGSLYTSWAAAGRDTGSLGLPSGSQVTESNITYQVFTGGYIAGISGGSYFPISGSIGKYYGATNNRISLGYPVDSMTSPGNGAWGQQFENGYITGSYSTKYWMITGSIYQYWSNHNDQKERLQLPVSEIKRLSSGWIQYYQGGSIAGSSKNGYWAVIGSIGKVYSSLKDPSSLGFPTGSEYLDAKGVWHQKFEHGEISGRNGSYSVKE